MFSLQKKDFTGYADVQINKSFLYIWSQALSRQEQVMQMYDPESLETQLNIGLQWMGAMIRNCYHLRNVLLPLCSTAQWEVAA